MTSRLVALLTALSLSCGRLVKTKQHFGKEKEMEKEMHRHAMEDALHFKMIVEGKAEPISRQLDRGMSKRIVEN